MLRKVKVALCLASLSALAVGCAHSSNVEEKQIATLRDAMNKDEADHDRMETRISAVEEQLIEDREVKAATKSPPPAPGGVTDKEPRVIQLSGADPDDERGGDDPDDPAARPQIQLAGQPGYRPPTRAQGLTDHAADLARQRGAKGADGINLAVPDDDPSLGPQIRPNAPRSQALAPEARTAYDAARNLVVAKKYKEALDAFGAFLVKWPDHPMADNAIYWRGECYFAQGDYAHASQELEGGLARFPLGIKAADSLLKLGMSEDKLGHPDKARAAYDRLRRDFSKSDAARRIPADSGNQSSGPKGPKENR